MEAIDMAHRINQLATEHGQKVRVVALNKNGDEFVFDENLVVDIVGLPINGDGNWVTPVIAIMTKQLEGEIDDEPLSNIKLKKDEQCK